MSLKKIAFFSGLIIFSFLTGKVIKQTFSSSTAEKPYSDYELEREYENAIKSEHRESVAQNNQDNEKVAKDLNTSKVRIFKDKSKVMKKDSPSSPLLERYKNEPRFKDLLKRSQTVLGDTPVAQPLSQWSALSIKTEDSAEFNQLMQETIDYLNEEPQETFDVISSTINKLDDNNADIRLALYSAVSHLKVENENKKNFYASEIIQGVDTNSKNDDLTKTGHARKHAYEYFKQLNPSNDQVLEIATESIQGSKTSTQRSDTVERFKAYFPELSDNFEGLNNK